jgi:hypothetical protein
MTALPAAVATLDVAAMVLSLLDRATSVLDRATLGVQPAQESFELPGERAEHLT